MDFSNLVNLNFDNKFVPSYVPDDLKWFERDGLETWYRKNKCNDFSNDTDSHFQNTMIVNFDIITNKNLEQKKIQQYQTIDHEEIKKYPKHLQKQITSSIFRNIERKDMNVKQELVKEHFSGKSENIRKTVGRGKFLKICKDTMYANYW